jgi:hypothetical protein
MIVTGFGFFYEDEKEIAGLLITAGLSSALIVGLAIYCHMFLNDLILYIAYIFLSLLWILLMFASYRIHQKKKDLKPNH